MFLQHWGSRPDEIAVSDERRRWTYVELDRAVRGRTEALRDYGAAPGHTVVVEADLSLEALVTLHAAFRSGALVAPLNPRLAPRERDEALGALRPTVVVSGDAIQTVDMVGDVAAVGRVDEGGGVEALPWLGWV